MKDEKKSKTQLIEELAELRRQVAEWETARNHDEHSEPMDISPSMEDYAKLLDAIPLPATLIDARGFIVDVNQALLDMAHRHGKEISKEDRIGQHIALFARVEEDRTHFGAFIDELLRTGETRRLIWSYTESSGNRFYWDIYANPFRDADGQLMGAIILREEITERKQAEEALRESEKRYRRLIEFLPIGVAHTTPEGKILYHNGYTQRALGYNIVELAKLRAEDLYIHPEDRNRLIKDVEEKGYHDYEYPLRHKDGRIVWVRGTTQAIRDEEGAISHFLGFLEDITEKRRQETLHEVLHSARDTIWKMRRAEDIGKVVVAIKDGLKALEVPFHEVDVNRIDPASRSPEGSYRIDRQGEMQEGPVRATDIVYRIWRAGVPAYRRNLDEEDTYQERELLEELFGCPVRCVLDVPFSHGTLAVNSGEADAFSEQDIAVVQEIAEVLSEGFQRLEDLQTQERRAQEAESLASAIAVVASTYELSDVLHIVVREATRLMSVERASLFLYDEEEGVLVPQAQVGHDWETYRNIRLIPGEDMSGQVFATGESYLIKSEDQAVPARRQETTALFEQALLEKKKHGGAAVPLRLAEKVIGTLAVGTAHRQLTPRDVGMLERLGEQAVLAIDRGRRTEDLKQRNQELEREIGERERAEETLRQSEFRFRSMIEQITDAMFCYEYDPPIPLDLPVEEQVERLYQGVLAECNDICARSYGATRAEEVIGRKLSELFGTVPGSVDDLFRAMIQGGYRIIDGEGTEVLKDGTERYFSNNAYGVVEDGMLVRVWGTFRDISDRKRMEEELRRAHNLESLGVLAGGIAHDFNNVLTGVIGNLSLLEIMTDKESDLYEIVTETQVAAERTKNLTSQLLTFSKGGAPIKETASIEGLIRELTSLSLSGSNTKPEYHFPDDLWAVDMDVGQIGQVMQNLVLNADQAMPNGGILRIAAANVEISDRDSVLLNPGLYVKTSVEDQGTGMSTEVMSQIFNPYFTTKQAGHGLGLSITHSIILRHGGYITVRSEIDVGTTFEFYLPASEEQAVTITEEEEELARGTGRILLMDDEETIHKTVGRMLRELGYEVDSVYDGDEALQVYKTSLEAGSPYALAILDLTIPGGMGGRKAVSRLREMHPEARVIVSSGYANNPVMAHYGDYGFCDRIGKPVAMAALADVVRRVLN